VNETEAAVQWRQGIFGCKIWCQSRLLGLIGKSSKASKEGRNDSKANGLG
jgi:hypothetical protein